MTSIKVGVVGGGHVAQTRHLPILKALANVEVTALADVNSERLEQVGNTFAVPHRYKSYQDLLKQTDLDAVVICTPAKFHVEMSLAALDAEKHILLEKPLALSLAESDTLIQRANQSNRKVMLGFNMRWHRLIQETCQLLCENALGRVKAIYTNFCSNNSQLETGIAWKQSRALGGGVLFEQAVHTLDLWHFLFDSDIEEIFTFSQSQPHWEDETATVSARLSNGVLGTGVFSHGSSNQIGLEIYGELGRLSVSLLCFDGLRFFPVGTSPGDIPLRLRHLSQTLQDFPRGAKLAKRGGDYYLSYQQEWEHFLSAITQDTPVGCPLEAGRSALQGVLAALESVETHQPVLLR